MIIIDNKQEKMKDAVQTRDRYTLTLSFKCNLREFTGEVKPLPQTPG